MTTPDELRAELEKLEMLARYYDRVRLTLHLEQARKRMAQLRSVLKSVREEIRVPTAPQPPVPEAEAAALAEGCG